MVKGKYNYFDDLEVLSSLSLSAVSLACGRDTDTDLSELRLECDRLVCRIEDTLFSDFLPPLERDGIAAVAHCLSRVIDRSADLSSDPCSTASFMLKNEEAHVCIRLAQSLRDGIFMLRKIKKTSDCPDVCGYRALLCDGRQSHKRMLAALRRGEISKGHRETVILTSRLRIELSEAFDRTIEVMLNNI